MSPYFDERMVEKPTSEIPGFGYGAAGNVMITGTDRMGVDAVGVAILKDPDSNKLPGKIFEKNQIERAEILAAILAEG